MGTFGRQLEYAQKTGEIRKGLDAQNGLLALNSVIVTPYLTPLVTMLITGMDPNSDTFKRKQAAPRYRIWSKLWRRRRKAHALAVMPWRRLRPPAHADPVLQGPPHFGDRIVCGQICRR